jgi:hypothetical protein
VLINAFQNLNDGYISWTNMINNISSYL